MIIVGSKHNSLTLIKNTKERKNGAVIGIWQCKCGKTVNVRNGSVVNGNTKYCKTCGETIRKNSISKAMAGKVVPNNPRNTVHGDSYTKFYISYQSMFDRLKRNKQYAKITICKEWLEYTNFKKDMFDSHFVGATLDRVNNNKGYNKENCQWLTKSEHAKKTRKESAVLVIAL